MFWGIFSFATEHTPEDSHCNVGNLESCVKFGTGSEENGVQLCVNILAVPGTYPSYACCLGDQSRYLLAATFKITDHDTDLRRFGSGFGDALI